jgi:nitrate/TMAO reductase-like tetraheme cytochrome c subunit
MDCHVDPGTGGGLTHGFRPLTDLTSAQISDICVTCHNGNDPRITPEKEAAVHENPGSGCGNWTAECLDCHNRHWDLFSAENDGNGDPIPNQKMLGQLMFNNGATDWIARIRRPVWTDVGNDADWENDTMIWACVDEADGTEGRNDLGGPLDPANDPTGPLCQDDVDNTNTDDVRKLVFQTNVGNDATNTFEDWAAEVTPYNGACNVCHTRAANHRRDGTGDQTHQFPNEGNTGGGNCRDCHNHEDGWTNRGGGNRCG